MTNRFLHSTKKFVELDCPFKSENVGIALLMSLTDQHFFYYLTRWHDCTYEIIIFRKLAHTKIVPENHALRFTPVKVLNFLLELKGNNCLDKSMLNILTVSSLQEDLEFTPREHSST